MYIGMYVHILFVYCVTILICTYEYTNLIFAYLCMYVCMYKCTNVEIMYMYTNS